MNSPFLRSLPQIKTEEEYQYEIPNNVKDIIMIPLQSESDPKHIKTNLTTDEVQTLQKMVYIPS